MKSIRLSLIVYFLLLLVVGLGAVCGLFYYTTYHTLKEKEQSAADLYDKEFNNKSNEARAELDTELLRQTRALAGRTLTDKAFYETLYPLGALTAVVSPQGHLNVPFWVYEGASWRMAYRLHRMRSTDVLIAKRPEADPSEEFLEEYPDPPYYQLFRGDGFVMSMSESLSDDPFVLDEDIKNTKLFTERLDTVQIGDKTVRRVTFKGSVPRSRSGIVPYFYWRPGSFKGPPPKPGIIDSPAPTFYLMCGTDMARLDGKIAGFQAEKIGNLNRVTMETQLALVKLQVRLWWIGAATFMCLLAGGAGLLFLGLRPLRRLSEAVSRVNERDFQLRVDPQSMPTELQPVVSTLQSSLDQLQSAFAREKQASADISHELRTPLAAILTTLEVALRKQRSAEEYREVLADCHASGQQMYHLVERLLALARLDAGAVRLKTQDVDVGVLAVQCANLVRPLAEERGLALRVNGSSLLEPTHVVEGDRIRRVNGSATAVTLKGDPDKLREVVTNLLHNAIEYNKPQGSIEVSVRQNNGHVELAVKDTGIGIEPEARAHIFERFYRADPSRQADTPHAGLGLSIVKSYVDLMGGKIEVESDAAGSTFTVALPAGRPNEASCTDEM